MKQQVNKKKLTNISVLFNWKQLTYRSSWGGQTCHPSPTRVVKTRVSFWHAHAGVSVADGSTDRWWWVMWVLYTQIIIFEFLFKQPRIRLYLSFSDWFGTKRTSVWFQINRKMINTIWFRFDLIRFRKDLSVCTVQGNFYPRRKFLVKLRNGLQFLIKFEVVWLCFQFSVFFFRTKILFNSKLSKTIFRFIQKETIHL